MHKDLDLGFAKDNTGDNISIKNPYYCEYTALYWGWKNLKDTKYVGLCHYRRYFDIQISEDNVEKILEGKDILVIKQNFKMISKSQRLQNLINMTSTEDAWLFLDTLLSIHPDCKSKIMEYYFNSTISFPHSMFIATKDIYDKYCEFIFPVLFEMEKRMMPRGYSRQKRAIGYFGEYSLGLFVICNNLKYKEIPIIAYGTADYKITFKQKCIRNLLRANNAILDIFRKEKKELVCPETIKNGFKQDNIELRALK